MAPTYSTVKALGQDIAVLDAGMGRPMLLLHGFTLNARSWRYQWDLLTEAGFRLIAPDNPGFGRTRLSGNFSARAEDYAELHDALLTALGIDGPVPVVGHSLGGGMAIYLARRFPRRVSAIVAIAPATEPSHSAVRVARVATLDGFNEVAPLFFTRDRLRHIVKSAYGPNPQPDEIIEDYVEGISVSDAFSVVTTYFSESFKDMPEHYGEIDVPSLIVAGEEDPHNPLALSERPAREMPRADLKLLPGLAHCPHEEDPSRFNPILMDFLENRLGH